MRGRKPYENRKHTVMGHENHYMDPTAVYLEMGLIIFRRYADDLGRFLWKVSHKKENNKYAN